MSKGAKFSCCFFFSFLIHPVCAYILLECSVFLCELFVPFLLSFKRNNYSPRAIVVNTKPDLIGVSRKACTQTRAHTHTCAHTAYTSIYDEWKQCRTIVPPALHREKEVENDNEVIVPCTLFFRYNNISVYPAESVDLQL